MTALDQRAYFFDAGIHFACRRCGACCTGAPGIVRVNTAEIAAMAAHLGLPAPGVIQAYLTAFEDGYRIRETDAGCCLFLEEGCRIYAVRPAQCRTFPFWFRNLRSEARWKAVERQCPGIGAGHRYTREDILRILDAGMTEEAF